MTDEATYINILGEEITYAEDRRSIYQLKFYEENPRVLSKLVRAEKLDGSPEEKQEAIEEGLREESSVKILLRTIPDHGGISEPLIIRPNGDVLEGNSRLAALRKLSGDKKLSKESYLTAPCKVVDLNEEQIDAFLHQQHVDGKTEWTAYDKAYTAYHRIRIDGVPLSEYADRTSDTEQRIKKWIEIIELMGSEDVGDKTDYYSYYDVIVASNKMKNAFEKSPPLRRYLLDLIKQPDCGFTATEMRDKVPQIADKPKALKKWMDGKIDFEDAVNASHVSQPKQLVAKALSNLNSIEASSINNLDNNERNSLKIEIKKCSREITRIQNAIEKGNNK